MCAPLDIYVCVRKFCLILTNKIYCKNIYSFSYCQCIANFLT